MKQNRKGSADSNISSISKLSERMADTRYSPKILPKLSFDSRSNSADSINDSIHIDLSEADGNNFEENPINRSNAGESCVGCAKNVTSYRVNLDNVLRKLRVHKENMLNIADNVQDKQLLNCYEKVEKHLCETIDNLQKVQNDRKIAILSRRSDTVSDLSLKLASMYSAAMRNVEANLPELTHHLDETHLNWRSSNNEDTHSDIMRNWTDNDSDFGNEKNFSANKCFSLFSSLERAEETHFPKAAKALGILNLDGLPLGSEAATFSQKSAKSDKSSKIREKLPKNLNDDFHESMRVAKVENDELSQSLSNLSRLIGSVREPSPPRSSYHRNTSRKPTNESFLRLSNAVGHLAVSSSEIGEVQPPHTCQMCRCECGAYMNKENEIVPALKARLNTFAGAENPTTLTVNGFLDKINRSDQVYAKRAVEEFGLETTANIYSKNFKDRQNALQRISRHLDAVVNERDAEQALTLAIPALSHFLADELFKVFSISVDLLEFILEHFVVRHNIPFNHVQKVIDRSLHSLITRRCDTEYRFSAKAKDAIEKILGGDVKVANYFVQRLKEPFHSSESLRFQRGKAIILWNFCKENFCITGIPCLTSKSICGFALSCLEHSNAKIRKIGHNLIALAYKNGNRDEIRSMLPPFSPTDRTLRILFLELERIDEDSDEDENKFEKSRLSVSSTERQDQRHVRLLINESE